MQVSIATRNLRCAGRVDSRTTVRRDIWTVDRGPADKPRRLARWGHYGTPVLLYPSAGADCLEVERCGLIGALAELIDAGRIKIYSPDACAPRAWLARGGSLTERAQVLAACSQHTRTAIVPRIRSDCESPAIEIVAAGAALGALTALASLLGDPDAFRAAVALSGVFENLGYVRGPLEPAARATLPALASLVATAAPRIRERRVLLAAGRGDYEVPGETERAAAALEAHGIPRRVELWGADAEHGFATWRRMLPRYLAELA